MPFKNIFFETLLICLKSQVSDLAIFKLFMIQVKRWKTKQEILWLQVALS